MLNRREPCNDNCGTPRVAATERSVREILSVLILCSASITAVAASAQTSSALSTAPQTTTQCDGIASPQRLTHSKADQISSSIPGGSQLEASDSQPVPDGAARLKLSIKKQTPDAADAEYGQFCRREKPASEGSEHDAGGRPADEGIRSAHSEPRSAARPALQHKDNPAPHVAQLTTPVSVLPVAPPAPMPAQKQEDAPPIAQFAGGKLTIRANGQDLAAVLDAVRSVTGLVTDIPPANAPEPIYMNMGPSAVREVLVALFEGTQYNYILLGAPGDPQRVERVIASLRSASDAPAPTVAGTGGQPGMQATLYGGQGVRPDPDAATDEGSGIGQQVQPAEIPSSVPTGVDVQQLAAREGKTTGQILDELQKRQLEVLDQQLANQQPSPQ